MGSVFMYNSSEDSVDFTCACGSTVESSRLKSSKDGFVRQCCYNIGWKIYTNGAMIYRVGPQFKDLKSYLGDGYDREYIATFRKI